MVETLSLEGQKEYEVSFLVTAEEAIQEIANILTSAKMTINAKIQAVSLKLSYPIKKHTSAFFGSCIFIGLPENIKSVDEALALNPKVLRTLIITPPVRMTTREERSSVEMRGLKASKTVEPVIAMPVPIVSEIKMPILSNEGLEKKLEEILK